MPYAIVHTASVGNWPDFGSACYRVLLQAISARCAFIPAGM